MVRICKWTTSFYQIQERCTVTPNIAKWPCKLNSCVYEPEMEWPIGKLCEDYRTWTLIIMWGLPSIKDAMIKNKQKENMCALKWSCVLVAHPWERMGRSLSKKNSEKTEFRGGMNGKGSERSRLIGYWKIEIWVWWWNKLLVVVVIDEEWLDGHGDGCVGVWRLGGQWAGHKALGVEQFSLGFKIGWRDFDEGFYKDFRWPYIAIQRWER